MARFLTTAQAVAEIETVIQQADGELFFVSPFVQLSERFRRRLTDAAADGAAVHVVCRAGDLKDDQREALAGIAGLALYDDPRLHAKAFANGRGMVLTSLNLYEASEQNYEMGVWLDADDDRAAFEDAMREVRSIITHATPVPLPDGGRKRREVKRGGLLVRNKRESGPPEAGHCIRCGTDAPYDPKKPYCPKCFRQWARFRNPTYGDDRCHGCGKEDEGAFSLEKPECRRCYKRNARGARTAAA